MKISEIIKNLQDVQDLVGDHEVVISAHGGDHGEFIFPGDMLLQEATVIRDYEIAKLNLPNCCIENSGVQEDAKNLIVLISKYSIEVDEIGNVSNEFPFEASNISLFDDQLEDIDWLENATFIDFEPDRKEDDKLYTCPLKAEILEWIQA